MLLSEPLYWGMRVTVMDLQLERHGDGWEVASATSQVLNSNTVSEDPDVASVVRAQHDKVVRLRQLPDRYVDHGDVRAACRRRGRPAIDFVNYVQADAVHTALAGTPNADLPVLSIAAPFNRGAAIPAGQVTLRDVAGLYNYDNTLLAVKVTGAQVKDYLEFSACYFKQISGPGPFGMAEVTNAPTATAPNGTPDYNYDIVAGLGSRLTYDIDIAQAPMGRISNLRYGGAPLDLGRSFALAINNYRQSGGGNFPHVKTAEVLYNRQVEIRQLLIDWVTRAARSTRGTFASVDWRLVSDGQPVTVS